MTTKSLVGRSPMSHGRRRLAWTLRPSQCARVSYQDQDSTFRAPSQLRTVPISRIGCAGNHILLTSRCSRPGKSGEIVGKMKGRLMVSAAELFRLLIDLSAILFEAREVSS